MEKFFGKQCMYDHKLSFIYNILGSKHMSFEKKRQDFFVQSYSNSIASFSSFQFLLLLLKWNEKVSSKRKIVFRSKFFFEIIYFYNNSLLIFLCNLLIVVVLILFGSHKVMGSKMWAKGAAQFYFSSEAFSHTVC